jgi:UDP-N-acetylmuramoyl-tripeptide--D-alanyl-D-alanine ligase
MEIERLYDVYKKCSGVITDSRNVQTNNLFVALKGENFNGNKFAELALNNGAAFAIVDESITLNDLNNSEKIVKVKNTLQTIQQLGLYHRHKVNPTVIALTGSNGKTTTKELIAAVLQKKYKTHATKGNLNNHIGIPLTLLSMKDDTEIAIVEMGANHQKEIAAYCEYVHPNYGLITNIGKAHLEGFGGEEGVLKGKTELYDYISRESGKIFISDYNEKLLRKANEFFESNSSFIYYGSKTDSLIFGEIIGREDFLHLIVNIENESYAIQTNLTGDYNFENVLAAICIGHYFGVPAKEIKSAIENYFPNNNRSQKIKSGSNEIILDAYNANPSSLSEALKSFDKAKAKNKIVIIGEMMELGESSRSEHEKIAQQVIEMNLSLKIFTGNGFSFLSEKDDLHYFANTNHLREWYKNQQFNDSLILIKGSRKNKLESILEN